MTIIDRFGKVLRFEKILLVGILFLMTSCGFYSATYVARYTLQDTRTSEDTKELSVDFINNLADKNSLIKDSRYNDTDTLAFFGKPYHYFKFWLEKKDNNPVFQLNYWGIFSSREKIPYRGLFNELDDFLNTNFIVLERDIKDENNVKEKK
jgi:hypothetical protein